MSMRSPRCTTLRPTQLPTSLCTWTIGGSSEMRGFSWWKQSKTWILQVFRLYIVIYCDNVACNQSIQVHNLSLAISTALCRIWCMARETRGACLDRRPIGRCFIQNSETVIIYIYIHISTGGMDISHGLISIAYDWIGVIGVIARTAKKTCGNEWIVESLQLDHRQTSKQTFWELLRQRLHSIQTLSRVTQAVPFTAGSASSKKSHSTYSQLVG